MNKAPLCIAMAKGYLMKEGLRLFRELGYEIDDTFETSRKLFGYDKKKTLKILKVRPWDVPEYVKLGACDIGIVGKDVLDEKQSPVCRLLDLKFGPCNLVLAGPKTQKMPLQQNIKVATKFENSTRRYFKEKGIKADIIKLYGAIELAPLTGLSDIICDLTATGTTLKEHDLHVIDTVFKSTANLIANPMSMRRHYDAISDIVKKLEKQL